VSGSPIKSPTEVKNTLPIGRIEGSKKPIETHTPLIRYFINDIDPEPSWAAQNCCSANDAWTPFRSSQILGVIVALQSEVSVGPEAFGGCNAATRFRQSNR
jgi:hypothetical protein